MAQNGDFTLSSKNWYINQPDGRISELYITCFRSTLGIDSQYKSCRLSQLPGDPNVWNSIVNMVNGCLYRFVVYVRNMYWPVATDTVVVENSQESKWVEHRNWKVSSELLNDQYDKDDSREYDYVDKVQIGFHHCIEAIRQSLIAVFKGGFNTNSYLSGEYNVQLETYNPQNFNFTGPSLTLHRKNVQTLTGYLVRPKIPSNIQINAIEGDDYSYPSNKFLVSWSNNGYANTYVLCYEVISQNNNRSIYGEIEIGRLEDVTWNVQKYSFDVRAALITGRIDCKYSNYESGQQGSGMTGYSFEQVSIGSEEPNTENYYIAYLNNGNDHSYNNKCNGRTILDEREGSPAVKVTLMSSTSCIVEVPNMLAGQRLKISLKGRWRYNIWGDSADNELEMFVITSNASATVSVLKQGGLIARVNSQYKACHAYITDNQGQLHKADAAYIYDTSYPDNNHYRLIKNGI